jgi:cobalt-zinc-cadmium efflux system outer membrane protein
MPTDGTSTLPQVLAFASNHAPELLLGCGGLALGDAEVRAAGQVQPFNPKLTLGLGQRHQAGGVGIEAEVGIEQQLEIAGQRKLRRRAARHFRELTALGVDAAAWAVHADVHLAFERVLLAESKLALAEELVEYEGELVTIAKRKVELGDEPPVILEIAGAELVLAENTVTVAAAEVETSRLELAMISGWPDADSLNPVGVLEDPQPVGDHDALVQRAIDQSPILGETRKATEFASATIEVARRDAWPTLTLGAQYSHEGSTSTPNPASNIWMGVIQISLPTFQRNQGTVARSRADLAVAKTRQHAVSVQFVAMVGAAAIRLDAAAARVTALEKRVVPAFERTLAGLRLGYEVGEFDYLEVAQARERVWTARQQAFDARGDYYDAFAELERLIGPLPSSEEPEPRPFTQSSEACAEAAR